MYGEEQLLQGNAASGKWPWYLPGIEAGVFLSTFPVRFWLLSKTNSWEICRSVREEKSQKFCQHALTNKNTALIMNHRKRNKNTLTRRVNCETLQREMWSAGNILSGNSRRLPPSGPNPVRWFRYHHNWEALHPGMTGQQSKQGGTARMNELVPYSMWCTVRDFFIAESLAKADTYCVP